MQFMIDVVVVFSVDTEKAILLFTEHGGGFAPVTAASEI